MQPSMGAGRGVGAGSERRHETGRSRSRSAAMRAPDAVVSHRSPGSGTHPCGRISGRANHPGALGCSQSARLQGARERRALQIVSIGRRKATAMKIVVLDGYTLNPGDLSWEGLREIGELEVFER